MQGQSLFRPFDNGQVDHFVVQRNGSLGLVGRVGNQIDNTLRPDYFFFRRTKVFLNAQYLVRIDGKFAGKTQTFWQERRPA